jgi:predicted RNase H-like HicB family nuclease
MVTDNEWVVSKSVYRCHIAVVKEDDATYSVLVLNLPGAGSCGRSEDEAIENAKEAVLGVIEDHLDANEEIPWIDAGSDDIPAGAKTKWIMVNA